MTVYIPIQNEFVERMIIYKTIENSNMKYESKGKYYFLMLKYIYLLKLNIK